MKLAVRILVAFMLVAFSFTLTSSSVSASKRPYRAALRTANEVPPVVDSNATGSLVLGFNQDGSMRFQLSVRSLSGDVVNGVHLHAQAPAGENAPVILTLCGNPAPSAAGPCVVTNGVLMVSGNIDSPLLAAWNLPASNFVDWLDAGMVYVNVHTPMFPAGETRGQLFQVD